MLEPDNNLMSGVITMTENSRMAGCGSKTPRRVRVLYIVDSLWSLGGAEGSLLRMTKHLPQDEFECRVVTFHSAPSSRWVLDQFECPIDHWQLNNLYDPTALRTARRLFRLVREEQIDIVHTFFPTSDLWAGPIAKLAGAKIHISSRRDMGFMREPKHNLGYRLLRGVFDQVQAVSEEVRQYTIKKDGLNPERIVTIYNGVDALREPPAEEVEDLRRALNLEAGLRYITCVANLRHIKGIDVLVRAAELVKRQAPEARFLIAGGDAPKAGSVSYGESVRILSESLGTDQVCNLLGQIKNVRALLGLSDIFVLPSRSEGFSNALLEGMAAGLPCVATAVGGNPELVEEGVSGYLVPSDSPEELADRILKLLGDQSLRHRMGMAGRQRVLSEFTTGTMVANVTAAYRELLQAKGLQTPSVCGDC